MKNIKSISVSFLITMVFLILSSSVFAGNISTVNATPSINKITVSGTTDANVLAVAILVYSGENLEYMETCNVDNSQNYSCELNHSFEDGTYSVKVADYNGGSYINATATVNTEQATTNDTNDNTSSPKTGDNIVIYFGVLAVALLGTFGIILKKRKLDKVNKH